MSEAKLSGETPKGDGWGIDAAVREMTEAVMRGESSPLVPCIAVIDVKEVRIDAATGTRTPVVRLRRLEALTDLDRIRSAQRLLLREWEARRGEGALLPAEERELIDRAFSGVPVAQIERDEQEAQEDEGLVWMDRLRRHLVTVHGVESTNWLADATDSYVHTTHEAEHTDPRPGCPEHDVEWVGWRRVEVDEDLLGADSAAADPETVSEPADETDPE
jgi:hypothetical protein